jgi:hypothetical protein
VGRRLGDIAAGEYPFSLRAPCTTDARGRPSVHDGLLMLVLSVSQETAVAVMAAAGIVVGFVALAIVGWIFWRAAKRDREAERRAAEARGGPGDPVGSLAKLEPGSPSAQSSNGKEVS